MTGLAARQPGYWMWETSGVLKPAVWAYLFGDAMTPEQIAAMRAYFRQWIAAPAWRGPQVDALRTLVDALETRDDIEHWLDLAEEAGVDPL